MQPTQPSSASARNMGALLNRTPVWLCSPNRTPALEAMYACSTNPLETSIALAILVSGGTLHIFHQLSWQASPPTLICGLPVFSPLQTLILSMMHSSSISQTPCLRATSLKNAIMSSGSSYRKWPTGETAQTSMPSTPHKHNDKVGTCLLPLLHV